MNIIKANREVKLREWDYNEIPQLRDIPDINKFRPNESYYFKEHVSFSHVIGSVSSFLIDYIKKAFPENYVATTWNTMEELFSQRYHKFKEILAKPRPIMTIDPKFDPSDDSQFIPQVEFDPWVRNDPESDIWMTVRHSDPIIKGENFTLYHRLRRMKMEFNINFIFDSDIQRIQAQQYIRMNIRHQVPIQIHRYIENNIPDSIMSAISQLTSMDKNSEKFMIYLNKRSSRPITRRLRTGSGALEFFSMQHTPLDIKFEGLPNTNGPVKRGNIIISSSFSETVTVEFVMDAMYVLETNKDHIVLDSNTIQDDGTVRPVAQYDAVLWEKNFWEYDPFIDNEEHLMDKLTTIVVQADKEGDDSVCLYTLLNGALDNVMHAYHDTHRPIDFFHVAVLEAPDHRIGGERMKFDPETLTVTIKKMDPNKTYYITLYVDKTKIAKEEMLLFETDQYLRLIRDRIDDHTE